MALALAGAAEGRHGPPPKSFDEARALPLETFEVMTLPAVDAERLKAEDAARSTPGPLRYAVPEKVDVSPATHGIWEYLPDGGQLWRYRVYAPGATDLNFGFTTYELPPGATLHLISEDEPSYYEGPYDEHDNKSHRQLWTPPVPGSRAVIELFVPDDAAFAPELVLGQVGAGYRDLFKRQPQLKQGPCNVDVVCPQGDPFRDQIRSVARYSLGGFGLCTGQLVADVPRSRRPYFLTANHCGVNAGNAFTVVVFWNYESPTCGALSGGSLNDTQNGATFRAGRRDVDFTLLELDERPDPSFDVYYTGWDRSGNVPNRTFAIHHPSADEKAISFNEDPLTIDGSCIGSSPDDTHWFVDDWEEGTTEPGSSGGGLWTRSGNRLIGFLSGGTASCGNPSGFDCFGRLSVAWDGNNRQSRLRDWLDPDGTGRMRVNGFNANGGGGGGGGGCSVPVGNGRFCTDCGPCGEGEGDCDRDSECQSGLVCADDVGADFGFGPGIDVCVAAGNDDGDGDSDGGGGSCPVPVGNGRFCTDCGPCDEGEGDCDRDSECRSGLVCADNVGADFGFPPGIDVCVSPGDDDGGGGGGGACPVAAGSGTFCTVCGPCGAGEGDCDRDSECQAGLICADDVGADFGFGPGIDVCVPAGGGACPVPAGAGNFCDVCGPCSFGEGDCDRDSDCAPGLTCVQDVGADFGFGPGIDVCM
ncbi:MAG: hypothetical protein D6696_21545 [Acidobacteria bacterium]|nr:MAG: hypothetical protein D6696_21545 [Acidobacteriota bacterium]